MDYMVKLLCEHQPNVFAEATLSARADTSRQGTSRQDTVALHSHFRAIELMSSGSTTGIFLSQFAHLEGGWKQWPDRANARTAASVPAQRQEMQQPASQQPVETGGQRADSLVFDQRCSKRAQR